MIIIKVKDKNSLEKALKEYKSKIIQTRQSSELVKRKEFVKKSQKKRNKLRMAKYVQNKFKQN